MKRDDPQIAATIALLAETYPVCFAIFEGRRRPLKIGIREDLSAALDGAVTPTEIGKALRVYVANAVYRRRLVAGAVRIGLDGEPAGTVAPEHALPRPKPRASPQAPPVAKREAPPPRTPTSTRRLSLSDLRAAARRRLSA